MLSFLNHAIHARFRFNRSETLIKEVAVEPGDDEIFETSAIENSWNSSKRHRLGHHPTSGSEKDCGRFSESGSESDDSQKFVSSRIPSFVSDPDRTPQNNRTRSSRMGQSKEAKMMWNENVIRHVSLYKAAVTGKWEVAETIFKQDSKAIAAEITLLKETALHIVVGTGDHLDFVENLVNLMFKQSLRLDSIDVYGNTALAFAAIVGNIDAAKILLKKDPLLPMVTNSLDYSPLHLAAKHGHKAMVHYLYSLINDMDEFESFLDVKLLNLLITLNIYDIAVDIINRKPQLAVKRYGGISALQMLAKQPDVFDSRRSRLGFWQRFLYRCSRVILRILDPPSPMEVEHGDIENRPQISMHAGAFYQLWTSIRVATHKILVKIPYLKNVHDKMQMHVQACKLVRCLCEEALKIGGKKCAKTFSRSILSAARMGTLEVAIEIIRVYPYSIWFRDARKRNIFQLAVLHRQEKIYNLIYQMSSHKNFAADFQDYDQNNLLHLAGRFVPCDRLSGAALQFQRELQWFEEVERFVQPSYKTTKNKKGLIPRMIFTKEHESLVRQGEEWLKTTASSCTVVAALVATVAFSAVFTTPGGNSSDRGIPILVHHDSFMIFAVSDALALIASSISVMMFLGMLTSRYSEDDFLKSLPTRLIIGLVSLFISISSMVAAFSASLYLVLVHQVQWVWIPIIIFAFIPVFVFAMLQFPLLVEIFSSTYGRNIFGLQSKEIIH